MRPSAIVLGLFEIATLVVSGYGQSVIQSGESIFVITVKGGQGVTFRGSYLVTTGSGEAKSYKIEGTVPAEFKAVGTSVYLNLQNQSQGGKLEMRVDKAGNRQLDRESPVGSSGQFLEAEISRNGTTLKRQRTDAPHGVVGLATTIPTGGAPQQTELQVEGSAKFAFLTLTSETGDIEQQLVLIPFSKTFYPRVGWTVGLSAQKIRVTRPDPTSIGEKLEVLDDGASGSVHIAIRVNGGILGQAETAEQFGVASVTRRIP